jgi:outer membrane protein TolC
MQVSSSYDLDRTKSSLAFQSEDFNPAYTTNLVFEMRQPLLRGFGIDYNQSLIRISRHNREISEWAFARGVRDLVRQVEEAYWRLVQARRDVVISARLLAEFEQILEYLDARRDFDIIPVQLNATQANLEQTRAEFIRSIANVFDAEDRLVALMNSDDLDLTDEIEIIPTDFPQLTRINVDRLAEVRVALENRPELKEQELQIDIAQLNVGRAKNEELPRLDFTFRQMYDGLAGNADRSFDKATAANFIEYFFGVEFEFPIGNRGPRAASLRAQLQHSAAVTLLKQRMEEVIFEVNQAVRELNTSYDQIAPAYFAAEARIREVESIVARAERKDINTLNSELNARRSLADARRAMLALAVNYNIAIVELERAKGTLLVYNNIILPTPGDDSEN